MKFMSLSLPSTAIRPFAFLCLSAFLGMFHHTAQASTGEIYGYSSRAAAMGNTLMGGTTDPFATFYVPAANSENLGFHTSYALGWYHPEFKGISGVVIKNSVTYPTSSDVYGDVPTDDYNNHFGQAVAASLNLGERWRHVTLGLTAFLPVERVAFLDTGETYRPEYVSYRSRTQRPQVYGSLSVKALKHLYLGTGLALATNMSANATFFATTQGNGTSHGRFTASMKPSISPYFSLYTDTKPVSGGLTFRLPNRYKTELTTGADAKLFGSAGSFSVAFDAASTLYYDPLEVDLGVGLRLRESTFLTAEVDYLRYKDFESPSLKIVNRSGGTLLVADTVSNLPELRDIWVAKLGWEETFDAWAGRLGWIYRPSPIKSNSGPGNLVDPSKMVFTIGAGLDLHKKGWLQQKVRIDAHLQYHHLFESHIDKSAGNEFGSGGSKIGAPGYDIGGHIYGGGLMATLEI